ncbi:cystathionine beta-lyase [Ferruginivarius sediminum]|uniref:Cystathionine beta-lyase n=1 Tax=Ferruginivarius sediminum TaxID=2661937 RepID=A0A369TF62_9PROT|nr:cystathionine beta-lyase [Ferruginivarius sediminum]RDD63890.1 cystathionine beta-lyase [Ferruginivarius sediminum]
MARDRRKPTTRLTHLGRDPKRFAGAVNPPVFHASTILSPDLAGYQAGGQRRFEKGATVYGRFGTPTQHALQDALTDLEGGADTLLFPSGLAAITTALMTVLASGDHVLVADSAYRPTRSLCDGLLRRFGVETTYFDPTLDGDALMGLIRPETKAILLESPGSMTFEVQDVPALAAAAKSKGLAVLMDNTWATPLFFRPLEHGVDLSIQAATKYIVGHADAMLGAVTANDEWASALRKTTFELGMAAAPDDAYLGMRGLRTLDVRLRRHWQNALELAAWLQARDEVASVLYPPLEQHPQHGLWKRDFDGASGLFGVVLSHPYSDAAVASMCDGYELFGIGASWGGFESLVIAGRPHRTATAWKAAAPVLRFHAGLEDAGDLIADLEAGFQRLNAATDE